LEKRPVTATRSGSVQVATAEADAVTAMPRGIQKNADGCYFLAPGFDSAIVTLTTGDKLCTVDGQPGLTITRISDDAIYWDAINAGYKDVRCRVYTDPRTNCGALIFNLKATWAARAVKMDATGKITASVEFRAQ
jgi:hypothetical protein